jgi:hypothetical protein
MTKAAGTEQTIILAVWLFLFEKKTMIAIDYRNVYPDELV